MDSVDVSTDTEIGRRNQSSSPLLRLPAEIRNLIYTYIITSSTGTYELRDTTQCHKSYSPSSSTHRSNDDVAKHHLSILLVCRQIYLETHTLPFTLNTLSVDPSGYRHMSFQLTPLQLRSVQSLCLTVTLSDREWRLPTCTLYPFRERGFPTDLRAWEGLRRVRVKIRYRNSRAVGETEWERERLSLDLEAAEEIVRGFVMHGKKSGELECEVVFVGLLGAVRHGLIASGKGLIRLISE